MKKKFKSPYIKVVQLSSSPVLASSADPNIRFTNSSDGQNQYVITPKGFD